MSIIMPGHTVVEPWGRWMVMGIGGLSMRGKLGWLTRRVTVDPEHQTSLHSHEHRAEHWVVVEGEGTMVLGDYAHVRVLLPGMHADIPPRQLHRLGNISRRPVVVIETLVGDVDLEDKIRLRDDYGR